MHKVQIKSSDGMTRVILDGHDISEQCLSFHIEQEGTESPELTVTLSCGELEIDAETALIFKQMVNLHMP